MALISKIHINEPIDSLYFDPNHAHVLLVFSDAKLSTIKDLPIHWSQCRATLIPPSINYGRRRVLSGLISRYKKEMPEQKWMLTFPRQIENNKLVIYVIHAKDFEYADWIYCRCGSEKKFVDTLFTRVLNRYYESIKRKYPYAKVHFLFHHTDPTSSLRSVFEYLADRPRVLEDYRKYITDDVILGAVPNNTLFAIVDSFGRLSRQALKTMLFTTEVEPEEKSTKPIKVKNSFVKPIVSKSLLKSAVDVAETPKGKPIYKVSITELKKILRKYGIKDEAAIALVKDEVEDYLNNVKEVNPNDLESVILDAIYRSVYGTERPEGQATDIKSLVETLAVEKFARKLSYSKSPAIPLDPNEIIDLKESTSAFRHEIEFEHWVDKHFTDLFKALETRPDNPVKVLKIDREIIDEPDNRYIRYTVTLQNTDCGSKKPYQVELKVPYPINGRYYRLKGKRYLIANQLHLRPITKTKKNEVRFLSAFATITIRLVNTRYTFDDIELMLDYLQKILPDKVRKEDGVWVLGDNKIYLDITSPEIVVSESKRIYQEGDTFFVEENGEKRELPKYKSRSHILFDFIRNWCIDTTGKDILRQGKAVPYFQIHIAGLKMPLIIFLAERMGLLTALNKLNIEFHIAKKFDKRYTVSVPLEGGNSVFIVASNTKEEFIVNGLCAVKKMPTFKNPDDYLEWRRFVVERYGDKIKSFDAAAKNFIDPITRDLLRLEGNPTTFLDVITGPMIDRLVDKKADDISNLAIYRVRLSEMLYHIIFTQIMQAHSRYATRCKQGDENARMEFNSDFIINTLLSGSGVLMNIEPLNPMEEVMRSNRVIKTGPGGVPSKRMIALAHRNIDKSHIGNLGFVSTSEYQDVGIQLYLTTNPKISNRYGILGLSSVNNKWEVVTWDEATIPFVNGLDTTRAIMATTHAKQVSPLVSREIPYVMTGAEYVIPQISSDRFVIRAEKPGVVEEVTEHYIKVRYDDGTVRYYDVFPRIAKTKRSATVVLNMETLKPGDHFEKGELLAWTQHFKDGVYATGKNLKIAVMNYLGYNHEDGYVLTADAASKLEVTTAQEIEVLIPEDAKVLQFIDKVGYVTAPQETLLEFTYDKSLDDYIHELEGETDVTDIDDDMRNKFFRMSGKTIKVKSPGGRIVDIRIYINSPRKVDKKIIDAWKRLTAVLKEKMTLCSKDGIPATDNFDSSVLKTGIHKHRGVPFKGVKIVFYISSPKLVEKGDKLANRYGAKGIVTHIIEPDFTPYSEFLGPLDIFISPLGIFGRKNIVFLKEIYTGKIMYVLNQRVKEWLSTKMKTSEIVSRICDVLNALGAKRQVDSLKKELKQVSNVRKYLQTVHIPLIVPPHTQISFKQLGEAAKLLGIPLDEHVYIPELGAWTKHKVPVGVSYYYVLEHYGDPTITARASEKVSMLTGQPLKGRRKGGKAIAIGNLDVYAMLSWNADNILTELMTVRSDYPDAKMQVIRQIIREGRANLPKTSSGGQSIELLRILFKAMALKF